MKKPAIIILLFMSGICRGAPLRLAVSDFTSDDNSYRSMVAAEQFTAAAQVEVGNVSEIEWVERQEWQKAAQELNLTAFHQEDTAIALRLGKWVKADWLVRGEFQRTSDGRRTLRLEIVDLSRADVLAEQTLNIAGDAKRPLKVAAADVTACVAALRQAITLATRRREASKTRVALAPLFFRNIGHSPRLDFFETDLADAFQKIASETSDVYVLRLPRAREATMEAELVVGGLVEADPDAWQKVADLYVWGSFAEEEANGVASERVPVDVTWYAWDGRMEPQQFTEKVTVADLPRLAEQMTKKGLDLARHRSHSGAVASDARDKVAVLLSDRAKEISGVFADSPALYATPQGKALWRYQVNLLSAARFFQPRIRSIQEACVRQRWELIWVKPEPNWFSFDLWARQRFADDFGEFVEKFGITDNEQLNSEFADAYAQGPFRVLQGLDHAEESAEWLADWPLEQRQQWRERVEKDWQHRLQIVNGAYRGMSEEARRASEHIKPEEWHRISALRFDWSVYWNLVGANLRDPEVRAQAFKDLWATAPDRIYLSDNNADPLLQTFAEVEHPEVGQQIWDESQRRTRARQTKVTRAPASLPPILQMTIPPVDVLPPQLAPIAHRVDIPGGRENHGVVGLCYAQGKLWISTQQISASGQDNPVSLAGSGLPEQLFPLLITPTRSTVVSYDPSSKVAIDLAERLGIHSKITSFIFGEGKLWLTLQGNGVWCLDPQTLQVQRFGSREGVVTEQLYASAFAGTQLFVGGGQPKSGQLGVLNTRTLQWTEEKIDRLPQITHVCGFKQFLLVGAQDSDGSPAHVSGLKVLLTDTQRGSWSDLTKSLYLEVKGLFTDTQQAGWTDLTKSLYADSPRTPSQSENPDLIVSSADPKGFWLGTTSGLVYLNPGDGTIRKWFSPPGEQGSYAVPGHGPNWLSHRPGSATNRVRPTTRLRGSVTALAQDGDFLWVATTTAWDKYLLHKRGAPANVFDPDNENFVFLYHKPSGLWVGQFRIDSRATALAVSDEQLWIGLERADGGTLLEVDKRPLLQVPQSNWASDNVSAEELGKRIGDLDVIEQARYYFLMGDTNKVFDLLRDRATEGDNPEARQLIALCSDERDSMKIATTQGLPVQDPSAELINVAANGDTVRVTALLDRVTDPKAQGEALDAAAEWGQTEVIRLLLSRGVNVNFTGSDAIPTPLIGAVTRGRIDTVRELLAHGAQVEKGTEFGITPLHLAACYGQTKIVELLLEKGANIEGRNNNGWTPLMYAAHSGSVSTAKALLAGGAKLNALDNSGRTALQVAESQHRMRIATFLREMTPSQVK